MRFKKIYIEITNRCNLNCSFCSDSNRVKKDMTVDEFEIVINKIKKYTKYVYLHLKGEPLIHPDLSSFLEICNKNGISVNITSNGINIDKCRNILLSNNVRQVNFSLHSYVFNKPIEYLNSIFNYINSAKLNGNYSVLRFWAYNGIYTENEKVFISQINKIYNIDLVTLLREKENIKLENNVYVSRSKEFIWPDLNNSYYSDSGTCYALKNHIGILSDGTIVPCCLDGDGTMCLGNIFSDDLSSILNSDRVARMINGFNNFKKIEEMCKHCNFLDK